MKLTKSIIKQLILEELQTLYTWPESPLYRGDQDELHLEEKDLLQECPPTQKDCNGGCIKRALPCPDPISIYPDAIDPAAVVASDAARAKAIRRAMKRTGGKADCHPGQELMCNGKCLRWATRRRHVCREDYDSYREWYDADMEKRADDRSKRGIPRDIKCPIPGWIPCNGECMPRSKARAQKKCREADVNRARAKRTSGIRQKRRGPETTLPPLKIVPRGMD